MLGIAKAVHRRGKHVIKFVQCTGALQPGLVKQAWRLLPFSQRFGHQRFHEHGCVQPAAQPFAQLHATGHQIQRCGAWRR